MTTTMEVLNAAGEVEVIEKPGQGAPAKSWAKVTKSNSTTYSGVRALLVGVGGSANLTDSNGNDTDDVPLQFGYNPLYGVTKVRTGGTADDIWVLY